MGKKHASSISIYKGYMYSILYITKNSTNILINLHESSSEELAIH